MLRYNKILQIEVAFSMQGVPVGYFVTCIERLSMVMRPILITYSRYLIIFIRRAFLKLQIFP